MISCDVELRPTCRPGWHPRRRQRRQRPRSLPVALSRCLHHVHRTVIFSHRHRSPLTDGVQQIVDSPGRQLPGLSLRVPGRLLEGPSYSRPTSYGWIHAPVAVCQSPAARAVQFDTGGADLPQWPEPQPAGPGRQPAHPGNPHRRRAARPSRLQTWWGFPTWRETLSPAWTDPTVQVNVGPVRRPADGGAAPAARGLTHARGTSPVVPSAAIRVLRTRSRLPPWTPAWRGQCPSSSPTAAATDNGTYLFLRATANQHALWNPRRGKTT